MYRVQLQINSYCFFLKRKQSPTNPILQIPAVSTQHWEKAGQRTGSNSRRKCWPARGSTWPQLNRWVTGECSLTSGVRGEVAGFTQLVSCFTMDKPWTIAQSVAFLWICAAEQDWGDFQAPCTLLGHSTALPAAAGRMFYKPTTSLLQPALQLRHSSGFPVTLVALLCLIMQ